MDREERDDGRRKILIAAHQRVARKKNYEEGAELMERMRKEMHLRQP